MTISTPGRICLFGEHQDYLGLPVIAMAISLRTKITGKKINDKKVIIRKPDLGEIETFSLDDLNYTKQRDYFKSGIKVCQDAGFKFSRGFECQISSEIPIASGVSGSSSIMVGWIYFLTQMADQPKKLSKIKIAEMAYTSEVKEFNESGGMMDQYSTSIGLCIYLEQSPNLKVKKIDSDIGSFILGSSGESKNTMRILERCSASRFKVLSKLKNFYPQIDYKDCRFNQNVGMLNDDEKNIYFGTVKNRIILEKAYAELTKTRIDHSLIGSLLSSHHEILKNTLKISTPKIELLINASLKAGALGAKINGSGGGGCMIAYAPNNPDKIIEAIKSAGGKAYKIHSDLGVKIN